LSRSERAVAHQPVIEAHRRKTPEHPRGLRIKKLEDQEFDNCRDDAGGGKAKEDERRLRRFAKRLWERRFGVHAFWRFRPNFIPVQSLSKAQILKSTSPHSRQTARTSYMLKSAGMPPPFLG